MLRRAFVFSCLLILILSVSTFAAAPRLINFQGKLTTAGGTAETGSQNLTFRIYNVETGGASIWDETVNGVILDSAGQFSTVLGLGGSPSNLTINFSQPLWLQVEYGGQIFTPRQRLSSVPYALYAITAESLAGGISQEIINLTVNNNITVSGTGDSTFNGSVGIGTTDATSKLTVAGTAEVTGFKMLTGAVSGYVLTTNASGVGTWQPATGGGSLPSGTSGQTLRHNGATWIANSVLFNDGINVGIGTTAPGANKLKVAGNVDATGFSVNGTPLGTSSDTYWSSGGAGVIYYNSGNVGIGTIGSNVALKVVGSAEIGDASNRATGKNAVAMGRNTTASGDDAPTAMGLDTTASGPASTAMGHHTQATADHSTAMGHDTIASGDNSTAMGNGTTASRTSSTAMGDGTTASGYMSTAMGAGTTASGDYSTTMGQFTIASGDASTAMGDTTHASGDYSVAMGRLFTNSTDYSLGIGNGGLNILLNPSGDSFLNGGNVGIGTTSPGQMLTVAGTIETTGTGGIKFSDGTTQTSGAVVWKNAGIDIYNNNTGEVGIGTTSPKSKLTVAGTAEMTGFKMPAGAQIGYVLTSINASGEGTWQAASGGAGGGWTDAGAVVILTASTDSVGIGTASPVNKLDVGGNMVIGADYAGTPAAPLNGLAVEGRVLIGITTAELPPDFPPILMLVVSGESAILNGGLYAQRTIKTDDEISASGDIRTDGNFHADGDIGTEGRITAKGTGESKVGGDFHADGDIKADGDLRTEGNISANGTGESHFNGSLYTGGNIYAANGKINANGTDPSSVGGNFSVGGSLDVNGMIYTNSGLSVNSTNISTFGGGISTNGGIGAGGDIHANGDISANGNISSGGTKPFLIDHPLDPKNKILRHCAIESPEMVNVYRGTIITDANGEAVVELPNYFEALNTNYQYQLTPIGDYAQLFIKQKVKDNKFVIAGGKPGLEVCWMVTATRHDAYAKNNPFVIEEEKGTGTAKNYAKGTYIYPEGFK